jgi:hypothetical protein
MGIQYLLGLSDARGEEHGWKMVGDDCISRALFLYFCDESIVVEVVATDWIENTEKY